MKKKRPEYQECKTPDGTVFYKKQFRPPGGGKQVTVTGPTPAHVMRVYAELRDQRARIHKGVARPEEMAQAIAATRGPLSVVEAWDEYVKRQGPRYTTILNSYWKNHVAPEFEGALASEITDDRLRDWTAKLLRGRSDQKPLGPKTIENVWQSLKTAINRQVAAYRIGLRPWKDYRPPIDPEDVDEKRSIVSLGEFILVAREAQLDDVSLRRRGRYSDNAAKVIVKFLLGLRQGEISGLGWLDFHMHQDPPIVVIAYQIADGSRQKLHDWGKPHEAPKGKRHRTQTLKATVIEVLERHRRYLEEWGRYRPDGPVFPSPHGGGWRTHADAIDPDLLRRWAERAGLAPQVIKKFAPHSLRHSAGCAEFRHSDGDLEHVRRFLGHADTSTTMQYIQHRMNRSGQTSALPDMPELAALVPAVAPSEGEIDAARALVARVPRLPEFAGGTIDGGDVSAATDRALESRLPKRRLSPGQVERDGKRARRRARRADFAGAWSEWSKLCGGEEEAARAFLDGKGRPRDVTAAAELARSCAYKKVLDATADQAAARTAGQRARDNTLASFVRWVKARLAAKVEATIEEGSS